MVRFGGVDGETVERGGGMERSSVVEVPRERIASPGAESATTVAGLSPVKGAIIHSVPYLHEFKDVNDQRITDLD